MTGPIRPIGAAPPEGPETRDGDRRRSKDRRKDQAAASKVLATAPATAVTPVSAPAHPSAFAAQVLGQPGVKKGLKGGAPVLETARDVYLDAEYSGVKDRRRKPGGKASTDV